MNSLWKMSKKTARGDDAMQAGRCDDACAHVTISAQIFGHMTKLDGDGCWRNCCVHMKNCYIGRTVRQTSRRETQGAQKQEEMDL